MAATAFLSGQHLIGIINPLSQPTHRRTIRGIRADIEHARNVVVRAAIAAVNLILFTGARSVFTGTIPLNGARNAWILAGASVIAIVLLFVIVARRSINLAGVLILASLGLAVWLVSASVSWYYVAYALGVAVCGVVMGWNIQQWKRLDAEFEATWTPYEIRSGDVFTVRDGNAYSVVKVLASEPDRVHVKQYGLRYSERPWQVKSSTLLRTPRAGDAQEFAHLPLDFDEFVRWQPMLLRNEPVAAEELTPLETWRRIQGGDAIHDSKNESS